LIPPLIGFFSKQLVLSSSIANGNYFMSIVAILVSVISASYYLKIIRVLHTDLEESILPETTLPLSLSSEFNDSLLPLINTVPLRTTTPLIEPNKTPYKEYLILSNIHSLLISVLTLTILCYVLNPSILLNSTQLLSLSLYST